MRVVQSNYVRDESFLEISSKISDEIFGRMQLAEQEIAFGETCGKGKL